MTPFEKSVLVLAVAGILVAGVLTAIHYEESARRFCSGVGGCETVNSSRYSRIGPVPVAVLGLATYAGLAGLVLAGLRRPGLRTAVPRMVLAIAMAGVLYSAYLTYLELYVIHAVCPWCVASAVIVTLMLVAAAIEVRRT